MDEDPDPAPSRGPILFARPFLADASHELRTPPTSIRGYAEHFRRGAGRDPDDLAPAAPGASR